MLDEIAKALAKKKSEPIVWEMCRRNFLSFGRHIFDEQYKNPLLEGWYHTLICNAMEKVAGGEIKRLIINMPPSYQKTEFAVRLFVPWFLGNYPKKRVIYTSYSDDLAHKTPSEVKDIITSPVYKNIFPNNKLGRKTADTEWYLEANGGMYSTTIGGAITGFHGNVIIIDDPMKAGEKNSKPARDTVKNFYTGSILSRLRNDDPNSAIVIIMQRLHEDDLVGYLLENEKGIWTHINITGIENHDVAYEFYDFYYLRKAREPLNDKLEDETALELKKAGMRDDWYPQYMQDPRTIKTGYVTDHDFTYVAKWELTEDNKCISIDPAQSTKETADNRAISLVGACIKDEIELYNVYGTWYGKWSNDKFTDMIITIMADNLGVPVFMESSGGGIITEQNLRLKLPKVNAKRKQDGLPHITNKISLFNPKTSISKNQKLDNSISVYLKNHQIRFVIGGTGQDQVEREWEMFHPERDSKEDDCIETIANVTENNLIKPKVIKEAKPINIPHPSKKTQPMHGKYKI